MVIWLQTPPWARWIAATLIAAGSLWIEMRPDATVPHPFAADDIAPGTVVDESNTRMRPVPVGTFAPIELGVTARVAIPTGTPVLAGAIGDSDQVAPVGWWIIEIGLPRSAQSGDASRLVLLDSGDVVDGVVVTAASDDPLGSGLGMVAVEPAGAVDAARAAAEGRVAVMIASP
jgi:hypothetical protein